MGETKTSAGQILLSGIQPTNRLTLGNYLGAIKNWVRLQDSYSCYFMAVDLHSITVPQDPKDLRENTLFAIATYMAAGINPEKCCLFVQSQVSQHAELAWILNCLGYMGELSRMTQFKDKSQKAGKNIPVGLFTYPLLMAADILLYRTNLVPVGQDQKQHLELTRDLAMRLNSRLGADTMVVPEPHIAGPGAKIMDLQDPLRKMSKSDENEMGAIYLTDSPKQIEKKFKKAVTDSGSQIELTKDKPGIGNLLSIQAAMLGQKPEDLVPSYEGKMYGHLKIETAEKVIAELEPLQRETQKILGDRGELLSLLDRSACRARETAQVTLDLVYERLGLVSQS